MWPFTKFPSLPDSEVLERTVSIGTPDAVALLGYGTPGVSDVSDFAAFTLSAWYRACAVHSGAVAQLPLQTLETDSDGRTAVMPSWMDNPCSWPGPDGTTQTRMTPFEFFETIDLHLLHWGDAFLQHMRNGAGAIVGLWPVHPGLVAPEWDASRPGGKRFVVTMDPDRDGGELRTETFDADSMTQIMGVSLDGLRGMSRIALARRGLTGMINADEVASAQLTNGATISGLVTPGDDDITPAEALTISDTINEKMTGPHNSGRIPVINRRLTFTPWTMSNVDLQFLESREFAISEVARWIGIPANLLFKDNAVSTWGTGVEIVNRGLRQYSLSPETTRIQQRLSLLHSNPRRRAEFDYTAFVQPSTEDMIKSILEQVNGGLITVNEGRAKLNLPTIDGGDLLRTPAGAAPPPVAPAGLDPAPEGTTP